MSICWFYPLVVVLLCLNDLKPKFSVEVNCWLVTNLDVPGGRRKTQREWGEHFLKARTCPEGADSPGRVWPAKPRDPMATRGPTKGPVLALGAFWRRVRGASPSLAPSVASLPTCGISRAPTVCTTKRGEESSHSNRPTSVGRFTNPILQSFVHTILSKKSPSLVLLEWLEFSKLIFFKNPQRDRRDYTDNKNQDDFASASSYAPIKNENRIMTLDYNIVKQDLIHLQYLKLSENQFDETCST